MRSKTIATLAATAATLLALSGCAAGTAPSGTDSAAKPKLALVHGNLSDPFQINWACGAKAEAKKLGVELQAYTTPTTDNQAQLQAMSTAVLQKPDGLILDPFNVAQFATQVKGLMQQGVPVISWNTLQPSTQWKVVQSNTDGDLFTKQFIDAVGTEPGTVAVLANTAGNPAEDKRWKPLVAALTKANPDIKVAPVQYDNSNVSQGTSIAAGMISAYPDLRLIVAVSGPETTAATAAVEAAKKTGTVKVWGYNATPANIEALQRGTVVALGAEPSTTWGAKEVQLITEYLASHTDKKPVEQDPNIELLPMKIVTKANLHDAATEPYVLKSSCSE